jgi:hypothetical protein
MRIREKIISQKSGEIAHLQRRVEIECKKTHIIFTRGDVCDGRKSYSMIARVQNDFFSSPGFRAGTTLPQSVPNHSIRLRQILFIV